MSTDWPKHDMSFLGGRRLRRMRQTEWSRAMMRETELLPRDLIWPLFVIEGQVRRQATPANQVVDVMEMTPTAAAGAERVRVPAGFAAWMAPVDRLLGRIESGVILISYSALILVVGIETLRRAATGVQEVWGPEIALYAFIWLSWFSMAKHGRYGTHLAFSELRQRLPQGGQRALELIDCALWLAVGVIIIVTSWGVVENQIKMGQTVFGTSIPLAAASLAVPVGWVFSMVRILQRAGLVVFGWDKLKTERSGGFLNL